MKTFLISQIISGESLAVILVSFGIFLIILYHFIQYAHKINIMESKMEYNNKLLELIASKHGVSNEELEEAKSYATNASNS